MGKAFHSSAKLVIATNGFKTSVCDRGIFICNPNRTFSVAFATVIMSHSTVKPRVAKLQLTMPK
jgi:hypothetical protein